MSPLTRFFATVDAALVAVIVVCLVLGHGCS